MSCFLVFLCRFDFWFMDGWLWTMLILIFPIVFSAFLFLGINPLFLQSSFCDLGSILAWVELQMIWVFLAVVVFFLHLLCLKMPQNPGYFTDGFSHLVWQTNNFCPFVDSHLRLEDDTSWLQTQHSSHANIHTYIVTFCRKNKMST